MKLVTWNAQMAFAGTKAAALFAYEPDIAVVQECSHVAAALAAEQHGYEQLWFGRKRLNASHSTDKPTARRRAGRLVTGEREDKGIAVFARLPYRLQLLHEPDHTWLVPLRVLGPHRFTLVAVWSWLPRASIRGYVDVVRSALAQHAEWFDDGDTVLAGDLNSSAQWDRQTGDAHTGMVRTLARRGLQSAYHAHRREAHGEETEPTFHLYRRDTGTAHIDYMFLPQAWLPRVRYFEVGGREWLQHSDHRPLFVDCDLESATV